MNVLVREAGTSPYRRCCLSVRTKSPLCLILAGGAEGGRISARSVSIRALHVPTATSNRAVAAGSSAFHCGTHESRAPSPTRSRRGAGVPAALRTPQPSPSALCHRCSAREPSCRQQARKRAVARPRRGRSASSLQHPAVTGEPGWLIHSYHAGVTRTGDPLVSNGELQTRSDCQHLSCTDERILSLHRQTKMGPLPS